MKRITYNLKSGLLLSLVIGASALLAGCSGPPSAGDGERAIQDRISQASEGRVKLINFRKDNGAEGELAGFKFYKLDFTAEIEFTESCNWVTGFTGTTLSFQTTKLPDKKQGSTSEFMEKALSPGEVMRKGQRVQLVGVISFLKKEKGWGIDGVGISNAIPVASFDSRRSLTALTKEAEAGEAKAQYELGKMYALGDGVQTNAAEAFKWYRKAADQGYAPGQNALGSMYRRGFGVDKDAIEAVRLFRLAADKGEPKAMANLGIAYRDGEGVTKDQNEAVKYFRKAAEAGNSIGQSLLGTAYERGWGVSTNNVEALKWFQKAAENGEQWSQFHLGILYEKGEGVASNSETAVMWYRKATNGDNSDLNQMANSRLRELSMDPEDVARRESVECVNNLKIIGMAFRQWAGDHRGEYPFNISTNEGGTLELSVPGSDGYDGSACLIFQVMSNEISNAKFLVCPSDHGKRPVDDFQHLLSGNVSFLVRSGSNVSEINPHEILVRCPIHRHFLYCDGSVQSFSK